MPKDQYMSQQDLNGKKEDFYDMKFNITGKRENLFCYIQHGGGDDNSLLSYLVWVPGIEGLFQ